MRVIGNFSGSIGCGAGCIFWPEVVLEVTSLLCHVTCHVTHVNYDNDVTSRDLTLGHVCATCQHPVQPVITSVQPVITSGVNPSS